MYNFCLKFFEIKNKKVQVKNSKRFIIIIKRKILLMSNKKNNNKSDTN